MNAEFIDGISSVCVLGQMDGPKQVVVLKLIVDYEREIDVLLTSWCADAVFDQLKQAGVKGYQGEKPMEEEKQSETH